MRAAKSEPSLVAFVLSTKTQLILFGKIHCMLYFLQPIKLLAMNILMRFWEKYEISQAAEKLKLLMYI